MLRTADKTLFIGSPPDPPSTASQGRVSFELGLLWADTQKQA